MVSKKHGRRDVGGGTLSVIAAVTAQKNDLHIVFGAK
jgi:hypothetical protein